MSNVRACGKAVLLVVLSLLLGACSPKSKIVPPEWVSTDVSELELDPSQAPTLVYKRPAAPSLANYDRFIVDPVQVVYSDPDMKELDPEQVAKMQQYLQTAMIEELKAGGYGVGTRSQANTLRVSLKISGLEASTTGGATNLASMAAGAAVGLPMVFSISVGEVTVEGVFRDALTNRIEAVVLDRSQGSRTFNARPWSTWADVEATFDKWARGLREAVDTAHGR